uniref:Uncharacterized protein n=1 Tax=Manihot esculenta TaxID=3983 RepID=A0A2C9VSU1_MANES
MQTLSLRTLSAYPAHPGVFMNWQPWPTYLRLLYSRREESSIKPHQKPNFYIEIKQQRNRDPLRN